jgi:hypothetical protein
MSELSVGQLKGLTVNNNVMTIPSGHTLYAPGHVIQVVNGSFGTSVSTGGATWVDTGLTATITPKYTTSKILIIVQQNGCGKSGADTTLLLRLRRNDSDVTYFSTGGAWTASTATNLGQSMGTSFLDSPNSTSALTYKTQMSAFSPNVGTVFVQHSVGAGFPTSTITLMEIAA